MVFSIVVYFTFVSIKYNEQVLRLGEVRQRIAAGFSASSVVLAVFALIFIWYSNSFFTRKRKKEIGLYSLLGIKKKEIGRLLFYENIIMGIAALIVGIFLGSLLSKLFVMILVNLMDFSVPISLSIIPEAIYSTMNIFAILFALTSIHGYLIIYRFKLVDLFKADKQAEKIPKASLVKALFSILFIFGGYIFYYTIKIDFLLLIVVTLISVVIGTFLLFSSLSVFLIKLARKNKKRYYRGINMIGITNLLHRIKGHARTLAIIAVLSATTLTAMSVTASLYYYFQTSLDYVAPFSYTYMTDNQRIYDNLDSKIAQIISNYPTHQVKESVTYQGIRVKINLPTGLNGKIQSQSAIILSESLYNEIAELRGIKKLSLLTPSDCFFIDEYYNEFFRESYQGKNIKIPSNGKTFDLQIENFSEKPIVNLGQLIRTIVVKDEVYNNIQHSGELIYGRAFDISNERDSRKLTEELSNLFIKNHSEDGVWKVRYSTYYNYYQEGITTLGQAIFIGAFLGLVFLISTGSIIFFKLLSESNEEGVKYKILRNIGVDRQEIKSLLSKQILFFFAAPLIIGIMHSLVAVSILEKLLGMDLTVPISITILAYTGIYMIYYLITLKSYIKNINIK